MIELDRSKLALQRFIRWVMRDVDYLAAYRARVVSQAADGSLDVVPDNKKVPAMTGVPIRYGLPGVTAKVRPGARVLVEFANGDPSQPIATLWESASVSEITVKADSVRLADGDRPIAREGDPVTVLLTPAMASSIVTGPKGAIPVSGYILKGSAKTKSA